MAEGDERQAEEADEARAAQRLQLRRAKPSEVARAEEVHPHDARRAGNAEGRDQPAELPFGERSVIGETHAAIIYEAQTRCVSKNTLCLRPATLPPTRT